MYLSDNLTRGTQKTRKIYTVMPTPKVFICRTYEGNNFKFENIEYRNGLNLANNQMYINITAIRKEHKDTDVVYVAVGKNSTEVHFEFDIDLFDTLNPKKFHYYTSTLKEFYTYVIAYRLKNLDAVSRTIITNILYLGYTIDEASKIIGIKESDLQQILSGISIKTKVTDKDKIAAELGFSIAEYNSCYLSEALRPYEN